MDVVKRGSTQPSGSQPSASQLFDLQTSASQPDEKQAEKAAACKQLIKTNSVGSEELSWLADFATIVKQRNLKELEKTLPKETCELLKKVWAVQRKIAGEMEQLTKKHCQCK